MRFLQGLVCVRKVDRRVSRGDVLQAPREPLRFSYQGRADALGPPYMRASVSVSAKRTTGMEVTRSVRIWIWPSSTSNQAAWCCLVLTTPPNPPAAAAELLDQGLRKRMLRVDSHIVRAMPQSVLPSSFGRAHSTFAASTPTDTAPSAAVRSGCTVRADAPGKGSA